MSASQAAPDQGAQDRVDTVKGGGAAPAGGPEGQRGLPRVGACSSAPDLRTWLVRYAHSLGFYGARYVQLGRPCWGVEDSEPETVIRHLSTSGQADREDELWLASDPAIGRIRGSYVPFLWSTRTSATLTLGQRAWLDGERARGVDAGLAIPVQDSGGCPAYLSLFGFDEASIQRLIDKRAPEMAFLAAQFHALAKKLVPIAKWVGCAPRLSNRELECLRLAALGQTVDQSGQTLGISGRTVEFHLRNALEKLGAPTKLRAVVLAFGGGAASPDI